MSASVGELAVKDPIVMNSVWIEGIELGTARC